MKKIIKMVYETPFVEIVPMEDNLMGNVFSDWNDGHGGNHKVESDDNDGMGKEFGFEPYGDD